ncbi:alpha/beta hydrolase [Clostridium vincentii]|nr:alpha/beta hydrolase [Clostridium vincentii]
MGKKKKNIIIISSLLGTAIIGGLVFAGNYFYNLAVNPNASKEMVFGPENETVEASTKEEKDKTRVAWIMDSLNYKDSYRISADGLKLHGYEINNTVETKVWVVTVHGYMIQGKDMSDYAKEFYGMGYNVLIPDLRGHGKSEGDYIGMGWDDKEDILSWINYIIEKDSNAKIVLHGVSMGAGAVMMTSGEELPNNVKAIVEDCGYTSAWDEFSYQLESLFGYPKFPILNMASLVTRVRAGYWLGDASAIDQVAKAKVPMLFIHGDKDEFVPYYMLDEVYNAANCEKEKVTIEGATHAEASTTNPELYWTSIENFINKHLS